MEGLKLMPRKAGPAVWVYRWRETDEDGERQLRKKIIGTAIQYPTKAFASAAVESLRSSVNRAGVQKLAGPRTFGGLVDHYRLKELARESNDRKRRKTKKVYEGNLKNHIVP